MQPRRSSCKDAITLRRTSNCIVYICCGAILSVHPVSTVANRVFWRQTVLPLVARTARALTKWLGPRFGETLRVGYDADAVDALALEREAVWDRLSAAKFLTTNERRAAAGYSPVDGGDTLG